MDEMMNLNTLPGTPGSVTQDGEKNLYLNNNAGGIVNVNYISAPSLLNISAEQLMAIQNFSKQYYQLIVTCDADSFNTNIVTVSANRALSKSLVPDEIFDRCSSLSDDGIKELMTFPAIICCENTDFNGLTDPSQKAMYCYIKKISLIRHEVKICFQPISVFSQSLLCNEKNAIFFDLDMGCALTDLNRSAWSVHKANVFEAFREAGLNMVSPQ